jgi:hypothetical protein
MRLNELDFILQKLERAEKVRLNEARESSLFGGGEQMTITGCPRKSGQHCHLARKRPRKRLMTVLG